jgi:hypothetical protein
MQDIPSHHIILVQPGWDFQVTLAFSRKAGLPTQRSHQAVPTHQFCALSATFPLASTRRFFFGFVSLSFYPVALIVAVFESD